MQTERQPLRPLVEGARARREAVEEEERLFLSRLEEGRARRVVRQVEFRRVRRRVLVRLLSRPFFL